MRFCSCAAAIIILTAMPFAQDKPIPVEQEPHHKVVFKNESIEVMRVNLKPGERTLYHTHAHDRSAVELCTTSITQQKVGETEAPPYSIKPGDVSVSTTEPGGYSHRVHNVGTSLFDVLDVEFLQTPGKPSDAVAGPLVGENPSARAYRWELAPGAKSLEHTHHRPYLIVAATPMQLKMTAPNGQSHSETVKPGDFHWVDAQVTHVLANEGATPGTIVEFELK
jgi:quercetin dioxygenase-like cupin family protein